MRISKNTPCCYLTSVTKDRLPVFRTARIKDIVCKAFDEARKSGEILIFAYIIMPDHVHLLTDSTRAPSDVLRFTNGIAARRVIDYLKENGFESSLDKLKQETKRREYKYSLWEHHPSALLVTSEAMFVQKLNYIHANPTRAGLCERAEDYLHSSARIWRRCPLGDEPLSVDNDKIEWRGR